MSLALSVIIPVRDGMQDLAACTRALLDSQTLPFEILIVDDGSGEPLPTATARPPFEIIRTNPPQGSYHARNLGAQRARGGILVFVDSDVCVSPDTLSRMQNHLMEDEALDAVFGCYDEQPAHPTFVSQYRNLLHAFMHQTGNASAQTFWTGCGAIRRAVFWKFGGFALNRSHLRDVELGIRLSRAGRRILLDSSIVVKHLKRWTVGSMIRTDILYRGANWAEIWLLVGSLPNDLNVRTSERISVAVIYLMSACLLANIINTQETFLLIALILFVVYLFLARRFLRFLITARGIWFGICAIPLHLTYHLCCGAGFLLGAARWIFRSRR